MTDLNNEMVMFFWHLPVSAECLQKGPVRLSENIELIPTAQEKMELLKQLKDNAFSYAAYPQYDTGRIGCLGALRANLSTMADCQAARKEMWDILAIFRLLRPGYVHIAGTVSIIDQYSAVETNWHQSYLNIFDNDMSEGDLKLLIMMAPSIRGILAQPENTRLKQLLGSFLRAINGEQLVFLETFFQKLFPILDLLAGNPSIFHNEQVSKNIGSWLQHVYHSEIAYCKTTFPVIIKRIWDSYRANYLHLSAAVCPPSHLYAPGTTTYQGNGHADDQVKALMVLHEIVRLTLLSLLSLPINLQKEYNDLPLVEAHKTSAQRKVDGKQRDNAFNDFFQGLIDRNIMPAQKFWCSEVHQGLFSDFQVSCLTRSVSSGLG